MNFLLGKIEFWAHWKFYAHHRIFGFLEKPLLATGTNQDFIMCYRYFSCYFLPVSLWHFSHMSSPYLSVDGLFFFYFLLCAGPWGWLLWLKSKKHKRSVSLLSLMGNYQKSCSYISAITCGCIAANLNQRVH